MVSEMLIPLLKTKHKVLILVVVEYGLGEYLNKMLVDLLLVLILVVVEYGLGVHSHLLMPIIKSLNPCCGGIWSRRVLRLVMH